MKKKSKKIDYVKKLQSICIPRKKAAWEIQEELEEKGTGMRMGVSNNYWKYWSQEIKKRKYQIAAKKFLDSLKLIKKKK